MDDAPAVRIWMAGTPRGKGRPRFRIVTARNGSQFISVYTDAKTRAYETAFAYAGNAAMSKARLPRPFDCPLRVMVTATFPVPESWPLKKRDEALQGLRRPTGKPDTDNLLKMIDGLNEIIWNDDSQVVDALARKFYGAKPGLLVEVWPWVPHRLL
jgi:Holliday junction resolvase RusA-like endonuclease